MSDDNKSAESKYDFSTCFIHSALDDYGFSPAQFRVLCRIARRGDCTESAKNMARGCKMNEDTVWTAIKFLTAMCVITKKARFGQTSILTINPVWRWAIPKNPVGDKNYWNQHGGKQGTPEKEGHPPVSDTGQRKTGDTYPAENKGHKGNPFEGNPINGGTPDLENSKGWQLRKDLRETRDPAEREAIINEMKRRKAASAKPAAPKPQTNSAPPMSLQKRKELWEKAKSEAPLK